MSEITEKQLLSVLLKSKELYTKIDGTFVKLSLEEPRQTNNSQITLVTGLWDLGRGELSNSHFNRTYADYKTKLAELLKVPCNLYIYVSKEDEEFVWAHRSPENTIVKTMELNEFDTWFPFFNKVQELRDTDSWSRQASWLKESPQARLPYYNPIVMSKMFLLNDVSIHNPFDTEYFYWIDAGITNTVHSGYFYHDRVLDNISTYTDEIDSFLFLSYPYEEGHEIHGFPRKQLAKYCNTKHVKYVCRGGFFGGKKSTINQINFLYYDLLNRSLTENLMGTEESIFTILAHVHKNLIHRFEIKGDGLVWPFFEKLKNIDGLLKSNTADVIKKTNLYVLGFNSPNQFEALCKSFEAADKNFLELPKKILINNSTDSSTFDAYDRLCKTYGFDEIHMNNIGICGGRQYIAEHFENSSAELCIFFEDDMTLVDNTSGDKCCKFGFRRYADNLYETLHSIMEYEEFDFLKFSFSEFYGDNSVQWSWYNVPQEVRTSTWPTNDELPASGLDSNCPKTQFNNINVINNIPYISGQIYYSNWPQIVSKRGNKKMFLDTKWANPYEQTWMSFIFQETVKGNISPGILLLSPVEHNRFDHYDASFRKEN